MKIKKYLTSFFFLIFGYVALLAGGCGTAFAMALLFRCMARAWRAGWMFVLAMMIGSSVTLVATPVYFPLLGITGSANNRTITVIPDPSPYPLIYGSNLVAVQTITINPVNGRATNDLLSWGYTIRVDGWPRSAHIVVPETTNQVNVVSLITNAVAMGFPVSFNDTNTIATWITAWVSNGPALNLVNSYGLPESGVVGLTADLGLKLTISDSRALTLLNPANNFRGIFFYSNGNLLANVNSSLLYPNGGVLADTSGNLFAPDGNIAASLNQVASTNAVQAITTVPAQAAAIVSAGGGILFSNLTFVDVSAAGIANGLSTVTNAGAKFGPDTVGTTTSGIQEALNAILTTTDNLTNPSGGIMRLGTGLFRTTTMIYTPTNTSNFTPRSPQTLMIEGSGGQSSMICYAGANPSTVLRVGGGRSGSFNAFDALNFSIRNVGFLSITNAQTNMLFIDGLNGGIFRANIEMCWFEPYGCYTNHQTFTGPSDLVPIEARCNLGADLLTIEKCQFYNVNSVYFATDHGSIKDCFFAYSGFSTTWASGQFKLGAAIALGDPVIGSANGNNDLTFERNYFEGCNAGYSDSINYYNASQPSHVSYDEGWENGGPVIGIYSTTNIIWTFINPQIHATTWTNYMISPSSFATTGGATNVHVVDWKAGTINFPFTFQSSVTASNFNGSGSGLTTVPAAAIANVAPNGIITNSSRIFIGFTNDISVTNTTVYTNLFSVALPAGSVWAFHHQLIMRGPYDAGATGYGMPKFNFSLGAASRITHYWTSLQDNTRAGYWTFDTVGSHVFQGSPFSATLYSLEEARGTILATNSDTLTFQFTQLIATNLPTTLQRGSYFEMNRIQ